MKTPRSKDHVIGTYQVSIFIRRSAGDSIEFASTRPLERDHPIVVVARKALATALNISWKDV